ncbi:MAG: Co2+/Mg2+ efflux protein ApaG [Bacteroidota bacterium]|nr:Co2+/Mg2+ efflux protein ApaG [Bacteroidota bacterium]
MYTAITDDVKVSVETFFQESASRPESNYFVFAYRITIENNSDNTIKLIRRHWYIADSNGVKREVEGEGVVGQQPVLEPNQKHQYVSGCDLQTDLGKMYGTYIMERQVDGTTFTVKIPEFIMVTPNRLN